MSNNNSGKVEDFLEILLYVAELETDRIRTLKISGGKNE